MRSILLRRDVICWCLYDWANSVFVTSIATVLLPIYYLGLFGEAASVTLRIAGLRWHTSGQALWAYSNGIYMMAVAIAAPMLGAMADSVRGKRWFLAASVLAGALLTVGLATVGAGQFLLCSALYMAAGFMWSAGNVFYDGFLPELSRRPAEMDAISSAGYGIGYLGGGLMLALNLWVVARPATFGLADSGTATRVCFVLVAVWWAVFTLPLILVVRENRSRGAGGGIRCGIFREGFARLRRTLTKVRHMPEMAKFLAAFLLYNSGVGTVMLVAAAFAVDEVGLSAATVVGCILMVQFVGVPATFGFVYLSRRLGARNSIFLGIGVYVAVVVYAMQVRSATEFWILGFMLALVQGGTQAISRSLLGSMIPRGMTAEFYGFFSSFNKVGAFVGPMLFGLFRDLTGSSRLAILFLVSFFVLGFILLATVRPKRGIEQAERFAPMDADPQVEQAG